MKRLLVVILLMQASGVHADVYTWTDVRGIAHYTNKEYEIPERYKAKAKPLHLEAVEPGSASTPQNGAPQAAPATPTPPPVVKAPVSPAPAGGKVSPRGGRSGHSGDE
ncbi:MAG: hypothetical protein ABSA86_14725 [Oryzomonas sp.]|jgi:hypothetical protein